MKSIVNSQLTGKWYQIAKGENRSEKDFVEVMVYLSISCGNYMDLLYVGIREDRSKNLRKLSLKILTNDDANHLIVKNNVFRKRLKILTFNEADGIIIISDIKMKYFSILSRKPTMNHDVVEFYLSNIDYLKSNIKKFKLYSYSIVSELKNNS